MTNEHSCIWCERTETDGARFYLSSRGYRQSYCTDCTSLYNKCKYYGVSIYLKPRQKRMTPKQQTMVVDYISGMSLREIAGKHDCSFQNVHQTLKAAKVKLRQVGRPREINDTNRAEIDAMIQSGARPGDIARQFGVMPEAIYNRKARITGHR